MAEQSMAKAQHYIGGGHRTETASTGRGGHHTYFLNGGTIGVRKNIYWEGGHHTYFIEGENNWGGDTAQH